jgi:hypothetical protein
MAEAQMLNELVKRFSSRDRREAERFRKRYAMAWLQGERLVPGLGLEISEKGLLFATKDAPPGERVDVALDLAGRRVRARVAIARQGSFVRDGADWMLVAGVFEGIAADDWDAVVRFCKDRPDPGNKAAEELAASAKAPDDAFRLLPLAVQQRVVRALIAAGRLAPESDAKNPLLRMKQLGTTRTGIHRLSVRSRWNVDGEMSDFDSILTVDPSGNVALEK